MSLPHSKLSALKSFLALGLLAAGPVLSAGAQTLGPLTTTTPINHVTELVGAPADVLTFAKFDGSLGALLSVVINVSGGLNSTITVQNNAATASQGSVRTQSTYTITDPGNLLSLSFLAATSFYGYSLAPGAGFTSPALTGSASKSGAFTAPNILAEFTGPGTIMLGVRTQTQTLLGNNGGNTTASQHTTASATGTVTYNYTTDPSFSVIAVPEPGAVAMLVGVGTAGLLLGLRRKRRA